ncbi:MAG: hypothetical protein IKS83_05295, partial [Victivallales bacterium]|nr:hypothetical protein [Victivallales bacterium]
DNHGCVFLMEMNDELKHEVENEKPRGEWYRCGARENLLASFLSWTLCVMGFCFCAQDTAIPLPLLK